MPSPSFLSSSSSSSPSSSSSKSTTDSRSEAMSVMKTEPEMSFDSTSRFSSECFVSGVVVGVFEDNVAVGKHGIFQNKQQ
ncbi:uncharacterized protein MONOS_16323 [Monocercomonoides exilis]|uniref:uncharacterized protein n=1 Tax=Monocercomonoides exilis TaxID=2049356 RepID=UPI00355A179C|nr:hypothetical protein MONOS_16323 [Monocercomonoides exilis]|eukprot:MONOS_16323.1-p1 / transcript=MONOS_16323.1 / gene=MONOS_16323 / organism=Monocercomonoides_exilis_PA203 / gene_product=unspecified product / transcript_product=unspecified product / location=Mono_scaffold01647:5249-5488(-) / protein_length=80 / sequence_SO=supercontig / SO=protein_coding / is_pseudo=false